MNTLRRYVDGFFTNILSPAGAGAGTDARAYLKQSLMTFLQAETKKNALAVYQTFLDIFHVGAPGEANFLDLIDRLSAYEENAAVLIDKQRDHYIHAVNVFLLGLCVYSQNAAYREAFQKSLAKEGGAPRRGSADGEFLYRWGVTSLFHDIGYPVEIIAKQLSSFIAFAADVDGKEIKVKTHLEYENFFELNSVMEVVPKRDFTRKFYLRNEDAVYVDPLQPIDLIAHRVARGLGLPLMSLKRAVEAYVSEMARSGFVDHGFFSAVILLKWYGYAIQLSGTDPDEFYHPVVDAASAIFLHNYYRNNMASGKRFARGQLSPEEMPLSYLLILTDELQEWNRPHYGIRDRMFRVAINDVSVTLTGGGMATTYLVYKDALDDAFAGEKEAFLRSLIDIPFCFPDRFTVDTLATERMRPLRDRLAPIPDAPRLVMENLEKLAVAIHERYIESFRAQNPGKAPEYPRFSDLPDDLKYSNLRQARGILEKLALMNLTLAEESAPGERVTEFPDWQVEQLAEYEHNDWMEERIAMGWTKGERDAEKKTSPYLIPFAELPDDIKEYDREPVKRIPEYAYLIGMKVVRAEEKA